jgi:hypothetical protein
MLMGMGMQRLGSPAVAILAHDLWAGLMLRACVGFVSKLLRVFSGKQLGRIAGATMQVSKRADLRAVFQVTCKPASATIGRIN